MTNWSLTWTDYPLTLPALIVLSNNIPAKAKKIVKFLQVIIDFD
jgi:hypothetical protein